MTKIKKTNLALSVAIVVMLCCSTTFAVLPVANAVNIQVYLYVVASPNPVGVGQNVLVAIWTDLLPPIFSNGTGTGWTGWMLTITHPDGTTETQGPFHSDSVGSKSLFYVPQQNGTYYFQAVSPTQSQASQPANTYLGYTSNKWALTVQNEPITFPADTPLPTGYWARPINAQNTMWYTLGGAWLAMNLVYGTGCDSMGCFNPYTTAPNTAHILWSNYQTVGGIAGGSIGIGQYGFKSFLGGASPNEGATWYTGLSYEGRYGPPIMINGLLICSVPAIGAGGTGGTKAIDLRTGQQVWWQNISVSCAQVLSFESPNQHGLIPYLWQTGATYRLYDPMNGYLIMEFANASTGKLTMDANGNMLCYFVGGNTTQRWMAMWNSTRASYMHVIFQGTDEWRPPRNTVQDWRSGIQWNVTESVIPGYGNPSLAVVGEGSVIATVTNSTLLTTMFIGYDATTGTELWRTPIKGNQGLGSSGHILRNGVLAVYVQELLGFYGVDIKTGQVLYGPTKPFENPFGLYSSSSLGLGFDNPNIAYDKLYYVGYDGTLHCYNVHTGENLFNSYVGSNPDSPFGQNPLGTGTWPIADGKVYSATGEHSPPSPLPLSAKMYCWDANTGDIKWSLLGWWSCLTVSDGVLTGFNNYDGLIYGMGKGNSATTVQTPLTGIEAGATITITGTVTDQSPGETCLGIPAAGTPAIADASMSAWMEYLYMQQPIPTNANGVPVQLVAIDSSGASTNIGSVTSDSTGNYAISYTAPTTPGLYKIIANFAGSESYYASSAVTAITVVGAVPTPASANDVASAVVAILPPTASPVPTAPSASDVASQVVANLPGEDNTLLYAAIAIIIIAVLIGLVNLALVMRKK